MRIEEPTIKLKKQQVKQHYFKPCYIDSDVHAKIKDLSKETHISMAQIIDKFLRHGLKYVEIVEADNEKDA